MFRSILFVFLAGWIGWFWVDKRSLSGRIPMPGGGEDMLRNFQFAFDLIKQGEFAAAFVSVWPSHFIVLSLIGGVVLAVGLTSAQRLFARHRWRASMTLPTGKSKRGEKQDQDQGG